MPDATMKPNSIPLAGVTRAPLGAYLKGIGILRAVSACASGESGDPEAVAWWEGSEASCFGPPGSNPRATSSRSFLIVFSHSV